MKQINFLPSQSTVPDPSASISSIISSKSDGVIFSSNSFNISLSKSVVMKPNPEKKPFYL